MIHWQSSNPVLSIGVLSIPRRKEMLDRLLSHLEKQRDERVELLVNVDDCIKTVGRKRQECLDAATGKYIAFIDDDDWVSDDYVPTLADACAAHDVDVISFDQQCVMDGGNPFICSWSLKHPTGNAPTGRLNGVWVNVARKPWHPCAWNRRITSQCKYPESNWGEDYLWLVQAWAIAKDEHHIDKVLHHYRFDVRVTETNPRRAREGR